MQTPARITPQEAYLRLLRYMKDETHRGPQGLLRHRCGRVIRVQWSTLYFHDRDFDPNCVGELYVHCPIPFCATCEPVPDGKGCVHVWAESPALVH